jgi:hypothetical protein
MNRAVGVIRLIAFSSCVLLPAGMIACAPAGDYDIAEVAPDSFTGAGGHDHDEAGPDHAGVDSAVHETETGLHLHPAGERNHGTTWFFNQPWAATFVWGKMLRDSVVLLALAGGVSLASSRRRGR